MSDLPKVLFPKGHYYEFEFEEDCRTLEIIVNGKLYQSYGLPNTSHEAGKENFCESCWLKK